jgi:oligopeptide/dipeptide ABC transporter ATP-binding protein
VAPLLQIEDLRTDIKLKHSTVHAVDGISLHVDPGETLGIVGESGCGKTMTALSIMNLLPTGGSIAGGSIKLNDVEISQLSDEKLRRVRGNDIGMIFQDPLTSLNPVYSIGYQIAEAVLAHNDVGKAAARDRAIELLATVGIPFPEQRVDSFPHELSGGMRQRVVIAIAMANDPDVIIADEPTTALDVTVQAQVLEALEAARDATDAALILITHDLGVIAGHAARVCVMYAGKLVETGTTEDVFYRPRMPYTLGLLGSLPRLDRGAQDRLTPIQGSPPSLLNLPPGCPFTPRCPIAQPVCDQDEPELLPVQAGHSAACHFRDRTEDADAEDLFGQRAAAAPAESGTEVAR